MWDLEALARMNQEAHYRWVEQSREKARRTILQLGPPPVYPLSVLARVLMTGPPSLRHIMDILQDSKVLAEFHDLVRRYLPEQEANIISQDNDRRVVLFAHYFGQKYFPLADNLTLADCTLGDLVCGIPLDLMGFSEEDYHLFTDFRPGYILMLSLVKCPYEYDDEDDDDENQGMRVPVLESAIELVGKGLVDLIPANGWEPEDFHRMLDGTEMEAAAHFADWVHARTGCLLLDTTPSELETGEGNISWEYADDLTEQWPEVVDIQDKIRTLSIWLEEDQHDRFRQLLALMLDRPNLVVPKEQLVLIPA